MVLDRDGSSPQKIRIAQRLLHPDYTPDLLYNDIGLLRLEHAAAINDRVRPACLHRGPALQAGDVPTATGWGITELGGTEREPAEGSPSDCASCSPAACNFHLVILAGAPAAKLMKVDVPVVAHATCDSEYSFRSGLLPRGVLNDTQFCAGGGKSNTNSGDGGGPLQVLAPHCMYQIVGITSFGKFRTPSPSVYTRVSPFVPWIEEMAWSSTDQ